MDKNKIPQLEPWEVTKFWGQYLKYNTQNGCLEWTRSLNRAGYARASIRGRLYFAHRIAYYIYYMEDPGDLLVMHLCDNPKCCNPLHLALGTHIDNAQDMVNKGRNQTGDQHWMKRDRAHYEELKRQGKFIGHLNLPKNGADHPFTKLTADNVREIRQKRLKCGNDRLLIGQMNHELGEKFGVSHSTISAVTRGKSWKHIT